MADRFRIVWGTVLLLATAGNLFFLWRAASRRGEVFVSSSMKLALKAMAPGLACAAFFTYLLAGGNGHPVICLPPIWMLCYGVALLATGHFAPRSLSVLGWSFIAAAFVNYLWWEKSNRLWTAMAGLEYGYDHHLGAANFLMGATFGLFHLIYAACAWPRKSRTLPDEAPVES